MLKGTLFCGLLLAGCVAGAAERWGALYEPQVFGGMPCRVMKPIDLDLSVAEPARCGPQVSQVTTIFQEFAMLDQRPDLT